MSFKELLTKYKRKGATQKQKRRPNKVNGAKPSWDVESNQILIHVAPYSFDRPVTPWFWSYPHYYTPLDYRKMQMQLYFIQYPFIYLSYGTSQRPVVTSNNLVERDFDCSKEGEKNIKQDSKYLQPMWCPSGLSHTQKRRLQWMRKNKSVEQQAEVVPMRSATTKKVWWPKEGCFIVNLN